MAEKAKYTAVLTEEQPYNGEQVNELPVVAYEFVGSMYMFELANGSSRSLGTGVIEAVQPLEEHSS